MFRNQHELADYNWSRAQQLESAYYKNLGEAIRQYDKVLLFGPTNAKVELFNQLRTDHRFEKIDFYLETTDMMTDNQQHAFVKTYFLRDPFHVALAHYTVLAP